MTPITTATSSKAVSSRIVSRQESTMSSQQVIKFYTERLVLRIDPAKALRRLWSTGTSMKPFEEFGTEKVLQSYENDYELWSLVNKLREKFSTLRRREARDAELKAQQNGVPSFELVTIEETKEKENATSQKERNELFTAALGKVSTTTTAVKRVDYSKYKIVKRTKRPLALHNDTPKSKNSVYSSTSSSSGSADVNPNYN